MQIFSIEYHLIAANINLNCIKSKFILSHYYNMQHCSLFTAGLPSDTVVFWNQLTNWHSLVIKWHNLLFKWHSWFSKWQVCSSVLLENLQCHLKSMLCHLISERYHLVSWVKKPTVSLGKPTVSLEKPIVPFEKQAVSLSTTITHNLKYLDQFLMILHAIFTVGMCSFSQK